MKKRVYVYVLMTALCFATMEIAGKIAGNGLDALQFIFLRFVIGTNCLIPIVISEQRERRAAALAAGAGALADATGTAEAGAGVLTDATGAAEAGGAGGASEAPKGGFLGLTPKLLLWCVGAGILCVPVSQGLIQVGIHITNAGTASVIVGANGMFSMVFAHFIVKERMTGRKWGLLALALVGLTFMICPWNLQPGNTLAGSLLVLLGSMLFGLYSVLGKIIGRSLGPITQCFVCLTGGYITLFFYLLATGAPILAGVAENIGIVVYAGVVVTCGGYLFMFLTIKHAGVQTSSVSFFLKIGFAPLLSVLILGESLTWNCYVGIVLVLISSFLNLSAWSRKKAA